MAAHTQVDAWLQACLERPAFKKLCSDG